MEQQLTDIYNMILNHAGSIILITARHVSKYKYNYYKK